MAIVDKFPHETTIRGMLEFFHRLLVHAIQIDEGGWGYFLSGLLLIAAIFSLWLFGVALRQHRLAQTLPKGSYNEEIAFGWASMGMIIVLGPWIRINILPPIITSLLLTHVFFGGRLGLLERLPPIRTIRRNYQALTTALRANYRECQSIQRGFSLGNISRYISAQLEFAKFGERVIFGIFIQSCKITVVLAVAMSFVKAIADIPDKGLLNLLASVFAQTGVAIGLNFLFVLPCTYICLELLGARMLLVPAPQASEIESARSEVKRFCTEDVGLWAWGPLIGWLLLLVLIMAMGIMLHIVWFFRDVFN